jgi:hypothetical protein
MRVPLAQAAHAVAPAAAAVPARQGSHALLVTLANRPWGHVAQVAAAAEDTSFAAQEVHELLPSMDAERTSHAAHEVALAPA